MNRAAGNTMIRTCLGLFADEFQLALHALTERLVATSSCLDESSDPALTRSVRPRIQDAVHQLEILNRTVARRRAPTLVLGPPKAGKSALIDALVAARVADVSGLVSYPCTVSYAHADEWTGKIVSNDGSTTTFPDAATLREFVERSHVELFERVHATESEGRAFDGERHAPDAVRRIELGLPVEGLEGSGTRFVELPGASGRLPHDIEELTRGFADARAAAILVLRTDAPPPAGTFEQLELLLARFETLYVVLNVDTRRLELTREGELVPEPAALDPLRAAERYRRQVFPAALEAAIRADRVRVRTIDVVSVAARRIRGVFTGADPGELEQAVTAPAEVAFATLLDDVTRHLDKDDRALLFLSDSIRQADAICAGLVRSSEESAIAELSTRLEAARANRFEAREKLESWHHIERSAAQEDEWQEDFSALRSAVLAETRAQAQDLARRATRALDTVVDGWFRSHAGLDELVTREVGAILEKCEARIAGIAHETFTRELERADVLRALPRERLLDLERARIRLFALTRAAGAELRPVVVESDADFAALRFELPVRKNLSDVLFLRSTNRVRRRFSGTEDELTQRITPAEKARRLPRDARRDLKSSLSAAFLHALENSARRSTGELFERFISHFCEGLRAVLANHLERPEEPLAESDRQIARLELLDVEFARLREEALHARTILGRLRESNAWIDAELDAGALAGLSPEEDEDSEEDGEEIEEERYRHGALLVPELPAGTRATRARERSADSVDPASLEPLPKGVLWHGAPLFHGDTGQAATGDDREPR